MKEVHLFIIWENGRYKENEIIEDIKKNFSVLGMYNIKWNKFHSNLTRFYGVNLPIADIKEKHVGNGEFLLVVVEVENPKYELRDTYQGTRIVNTNMFDKKQEYRKITGGGDRVHATNSEKETNHDLTLLLGKSVEDYLKELEKGKKVEIVNLERELIGADGFATVKEMFYVLNNCTSYAIMRNYESLPEEIYNNEHNDIDIICESQEEAISVLNAEKVHEEDYRVQYKVKVEGKIANFDIRYVGDNYYYYKIEKEMIKNRILNEKGFYTVSNEDYFYTLLYHAILNKPEYSEDYQTKLAGMNTIHGDRIKNLDYAIKVLNDWLIEKGYAIVKPVDRTVLFRNEVLEKFDEVLGIREIRIEEKMEYLEKEREDIELLKKAKQDFEDEVYRMANSKSWKITKPLRDFTSMLKGNNNN